MPIATSIDEVLRPPVESAQYTSWTFSQRVRGAGLAHSLGTVGDAFDNAAVESFWGRMQTELLNTKKWRTRTELSTEIFDWIEVFYNRTRRHSSLGMLAPVAYESYTPTTPAPPDSHKPVQHQGDTSHGPLHGDQVTPARGDGLTQHPERYAGVTSKPRAARPIGVRDSVDDARRRAHDA